MRPSIYYLREFILAAFYPFTRNPQNMEKITHRDDQHTRFRRGFLIIPMGNQNDGPPKSDPFHPQRQPNGYLLPIEETKMLDP